MAWGVTRLYDGQQKVCAHLSCVAELWLRYAKLSTTTQNWSGVSHLNFHLRAMKFKFCSFCAVSQGHSGRGA